ncbi:GmrSD restriction endonuclease domain-containing protein [Georgenia ruanii]|uniref:GmrSD restriction endonuclease domain-containing protein n=1 Tax=Georgenia ruanii TaxID=348442 RepID=UPI0031D9D368
MLRRSSSSRRVGLVGLVLAAVVSLGACGGGATAQVDPAGGATASSAPAPTAAPSGPSAEASTPPVAVAGSALATAEQLEVKGRAPKTGYERDLFGSGWVDVDHNGCDTRNDILARDLEGETFKPGTRDCVVLTGTLADPYSGETIAFARGNGTSNEVQIDHVVALSDAWQKGAQGWDEGTRVAFANDPRNLLAVDGPLNGQKGDADAATWLPPNRAYRCAYVARQVGVKAIYGLWVTQAEQDAMVRVLSTCPDQPLPDGVGAAAAAGGAAAAGPAPVPAPAPTSGPAPAPAPADVPYANCAAARAAGAAPVHRGDPGYGKHLDRDGDGVGCE